MVGLAFSPSLSSSPLFFLLLFLVEDGDYFTRSGVTNDCAPLPFSLLFLLPPSSSLINYESQRERYRFPFSFLPPPPSPPYSPDTNLDSAYHPSPLLSLLHGEDRLAEPEMRLF